MQDDSTEIFVWCFLGFLLNFFHLIPSNDEQRHCHSNGGINKLSGCSDAITSKGSLWQLKGAMTHFWDPGNPIKQPHHFSNTHVVPDGKGIQLTSCTIQNNCKKKNWEKSVRIERTFVLHNSSKQSFSLHFLRSSRLLRMNNAIHTEYYNISLYNLQ